MEQKQKLKDMYQALEFDGIAQRVLAYCYAEDSKEHFYATRPSFDAHTVRQMHMRVQELSLRSTYKTLPSFHSIPAYKNTLLHIRKRYVHVEEISILCKLIDSITHFHTWIEETQDAVDLSDKNSDRNSRHSHTLFLFPHIAKILQLQDTLSHYFDMEGTINIESIPALKKIYNKERLLLKKRNDVATSYMRTHRNICASSEATIKNNRLVIPIKSNYKNYSKGVIHSTSNSEQTIFFEVEELYEYNNQIEILHFEKEKIIHDICKLISEEIIKIADELYATYTLYIEYDTIIAQYVWSTHYKGIFPIESGKSSKAQERETHAHHSAESHIIHLPHVSHPLIDDFFPVTISIPQHSTQLILTGPNAGGKTIALKTLGLAALMNQSGIPVPVSEGARLPIFDTIVISIGDHQDIATGQSTFSSHVRFLHDVLPQHPFDDTHSSLFLFDELCTGTDEQEGGALAWAILDYLQQFKNYITVVTTHSHLLKHYAIIHDNVEIAALEHKTHHYRILYGSAGASESAMLAQEIGLPKSILLAQDNILQKFGGNTHVLLQKLHALIQDAKKNHIQSEKQLLHIRSQQEQLDMREKILLNKELSIKNSHYDESSAMYTQLHAAMERVKQKDIKLNALINTMHDIIKKLTSPQNQEFLQSLAVPSVDDASTLSIDTLTQHINTISSQLSKEKKEIENLKMNIQDTMTPLSVGEEVIVLNTGMKGTIVKIRENNIYVVRAGILTIDIERQEIRTPAEYASEIQYSADTHTKNIESASVLHADTAIANRVSVEVERKGKKFSKIIDVRALNVQETMEIMADQIDSAILLRQTSFAIIHGKGSGILAKSIHEMLKTHPLVSKYYFATPEDGGVGKTYVQL